jgi:flagellar biosynthesis protein FlhB
MAKKNTIKEIKEALPSLKSEKVEVLSDELDRILAIKRVFSSQDGLELINTLKNNCAVTLNKLLVLSKENPEPMKVVSLLHYYSANIDLLSQLRDVSTEKEIRDQLDEAVKEAMEYVN